MRPYHGQHKAAPGKGHKPAPKGPSNRGGGKPRQATPKNIKHVVDTSGIAKPKPALASMSGPYNKGEGCAG